MRIKNFTWSSYLTLFGHFFFVIIFYFYNFRFIIFYLKLFRFMSTLAIKLLVINNYPKDICKNALVQTLKAATNNKQQAVGNYRYFTICHLAYSLIHYKFGELRKSNKTRKTSDFLSHIAHAHSIVRRQRCQMTRLLLELRWTAMHCARLCTFLN